MKRLSKVKTAIFSFPTRTICISFFLVIILGALLLMLPISSKERLVTSFTDTLFTATSATCVTGLVLFDTFLYWSGFGQGVILCLIQIGGLGLVTFATFFAILARRRLGFKGMQLAQESVNSIGFQDIQQIVKKVVSLTLIFESTGAVLLATTFVPKYGLQGIFTSIFLSVSAFCNAGFDILGHEGAFVSLGNYNDNPVVIITLCALIVIGGLGFTVWSDLLAFKKTKKMLLHTHVVLIMTTVLLVLGTVLFYIFEYNNPNTLGPMTQLEKFFASLFQSVSARTAGFSSVNLAQLNGVTKIILIVLMFIGASPGSTGGGIKTTTFAVIVMTVISVIKGKNDTVILKRKVPPSTVYKSLSIVTLSILVVTLASAAIYFDMASVSPVAGIDAVFETVSAFATVGSSAGVTAVTNTFGKLLLTLCMFLGRVGPVSFVVSLSMRAPSNRKEIIPEGKIMVG